MKLFLTILLIFFTTFFQAQEKSLRLDGIESEIDSLMKAYKTVGLAIVVVENDTIVLSKGFGYRNLKENLLVNENTLFPIGSITKQFTASLIGVYSGEKLLSINDKPNKYLKHLKFNNKEMNSLITIKDLLSHNSGIGVVDGTHVFFPTKSIHKHIERLAYLKPNSPVRERFDYSNMGYAILGAITEQISKKSWKKNIKERIFTPLQMYNSNMSIESLKSSSNFSLGYSIKSDSIVRVLYENQYESEASGAINSSINDMTKWMRMLLNKGVYHNNQVISKQFIEHSFSEQNIIRESFSFHKKYDLLFDAYGYGWFVHTYKNLFRVNHGGNVSGFTSSIDLYPYKKLGIVILTNQSSTNINRVLVDIITNRMLRLKRKKWHEYKKYVGEVINYKQELKTISASNSTLKSNLKAFTGVYKNKAYGTLKIELQNDNLLVLFPSLKMGLVHVNENTFKSRAIDKTHQNTPSFEFKFIYNLKGKIKELTINMQSEPVVFDKL